MGNDIWECNAIQFPRLIAEIVANVAISGEDWDSLLDSMNLSENELDELFERAQSEWERIKEQYA